MKFDLTVAVVKEGDRYVASCLEKIITFSIES